MKPLGNVPAERYGGKGQSRRNREAEWATVWKQVHSQDVEMKEPRGYGGYQGQNPRPGFAGGSGKRARPGNAETKGDSKGSASSSSWQGWNARDAYVPSYAHEWSGKDK